MKAKVMKPFRDKDTKTEYTKKDFYEGTEKRINELVKLGYVTVPSEEKEQDKDQSDPEIETQLKGSVEQVKQGTEGLNKEQYESLLKHEKEGKNRKGLVDHFESMLDAISPGEGE
ncbi:hypothetical protein M3936_16375 [Sutcliffiella horikoshii]|uniref:hypothetical protein n=1 Tax=Sutcliffiella horikoshii TaxID=79883 RepID=UPI00203B8E64|nr:hypothetical protein [Sutcliffiella horikoshii]MCM3619166.1 hypothetical protein [Sutcliffiella horikoshii]